MKFLFSFVASLFFFLLTFKSAPAEFLPHDLIFLSGLLVGAVVLECLLARFLVRYGVSLNLSLAIFTIFNILCFNLSLNQSFVWIPRYTGQLPALLVGVFILYTIFDIMDGSRRFARLLPGLFAVASVGVMILSVVSMQPNIAQSTSAPGRTASDDVRLVTFETRPNVYFISFDSLIPKPLLQKNLRLGTTPYHEVLDANFRRFPNFFADRVASNPSLNSLLALDVDYYDAARETRTAKFFPGWRPSPLFELFKHNGYETTTYYRGNFFGKVKGPFVDNYRIVQQGNPLVAKLTNRPYGICEFIDVEGIKAIRLMGYCFLTRQILLETQSGETARWDQIGGLVSHMRNGAQKDTPQVVLAYIYSPGHTVQDFDPADPRDFESYQTYYMEQSTETAAHLKTLINFVRQEDPTALLYVFGDHGPYLSRRMTMEDDALFLVQDRHGVFGGIFPRERCADTFATPEPSSGQAGFKTVAMTARLIVKCLAKGEDPFETEKEYRLPDTALGFAPGFSRNYEDYLYE